MATCLQSKQTMFVSETPGKENQGFSLFCFAHFLCDTGIEPKVAYMLGECSIVIDFI